MFIQILGCIFFLFLQKKNAIQIWIEIGLNLCITFSSMTILTISSLPIHEHGMSFHLSSLISSIFCSFECTGLSSPQLNLFYVFILGVYYCKEGCFLDFPFGLFIAGI